MIDGQTPALDEVGGQPEINISSTGWNSNGISVLTDIGFGNYYATLTDDSVNQLGVILSHYKGNNTLDSRGESLEIIQNYRDVEIFDEGNATSTQSYVTIPEGDKYFSTILKSKPWDCASGSDKLKVVIMATRDIDRLKFNGVKTSGYRKTIRQFYIPGDQDDIWLGLSWTRQEQLAIINRDYDLDDKRQWNSQNQEDFEANRDLACNPWEQVLEFPRNGSKCVPQEIKIACCEIAVTYLGGYDPELEYASLNVIHQSFSGVRDSFDRRFVSENIRAGINSVTAWQYLKPFLADPKQLRIARC